MNDYGLSQIKGCEKKQQYDKKSAITLVNYARKKRGGILRAYSCPVCKKWHVTKLEEPK